MSDTGKDAAAGVAGGIGGATVGVAGSVAAISNAGSVSGLSASGITSGLGTIGAGEMIKGVAVLGGTVGVLAVSGIIAGVALRRYLAKRKSDADNAGELGIGPRTGGVSEECSLENNREPMGFTPIRLGHRQRADWSHITHVKLRADAKADTDQGQQVLDHIRASANAEGVAAISSIERDFPARKKNLDHISGMRVDLRHMANDRSSGGNELNKGLLRLGWIE